MMLLGHLLPRPQTVELHNGSLHINGSSLSLKTENMTDVQEDSFHWLFKHFLGEPQGIQSPCLNVRLDKTFKVDRVASPALQTESYMLTVSPNGMTLVAGHEAGLQRGIMTVVQMLEEARPDGLIPCCRLVDWPRLTMRGIHIDLAREMEYRHDYLLKIVERLAYLKMNTLHLYLEGAFAFEHAPEIRPPGAMTPDEAKELCNVAHRFGIHIIPQIATLGHMNMLLHGPYAELREHPSSAFNLCPTHPRTRPFLQGLIEDIAQAFAPRYIHLGYDEAQTGMCKRCRQQGHPEQIVSDHLNWLNDCVKAQGARSMIYGDLFLSEHDFPESDAVNGGTPENARQAINNVNRDILITDWHYTAPRQGTVRHLIQQGFEVHIATASNTYWHDSIPFRRGQIWIADTIEGAVEEGATGGLHCNWELYRGICLENNWLFQALAAERQWTAQPHDDCTFSQRFTQRFWGIDNDAFGHIAGLLETIPVNRRYAFLDAPVMAESGTLQARHDYLQLADKLDQWIHDFRSAAKRNLDLLEKLDMPVRIIRYIGTRMTALHRARLASQRGDRQQQLAAWDAIRTEALSLKPVLEEHFRHSGGGGVDIRRLEQHLIEIEAMMLGRDPREWVTLRQYRALSVESCDSELEKRPLPQEGVAARKLLNIPLHEIVDLLEAHPQREGGLYLISEASLPHDFEGYLRVQHEGPVKVWVNRVCVGLSHRQANHHAYEDIVFPVPWKKGHQTIVFALDLHQESSTTFSARITPQDVPPSGANST